MRKCRHIILIQALAFQIVASSQTTISGVVNSYYKVIEVIPSKACVRLNNVTGLARLQKTLLVQMKGASVVTTNNSNFGDTTSLNNAGNYEIAIICAIDGDSVFMLHNFLNNYTVPDKVQLVKFAEYISANVTDTIKPSAWNNSSGTGGVLAISVLGTLQLSAPVFADSSGFRGGSYLLSDGTCANGIFAATDYYYNASNSGPQMGAYKGESVYDFPISQSGGRGAPANGGGGGNNHNNGGGGGANLSAGGKGGGNSSSAGCNTELHADPGKALSSWNGKKIFFGGGGGAGHSNGTLTISKGGGNGGGIILIVADTLIANGFKISANGGIGGNALSDGASGAGAAGTIIMDINTYVGSAVVQANGGKGGNEDDAGTTKRCYGAGGGGSGGVIYFTGPTPPITNSAIAGNAGVESGGDAACNTQVPAAGGVPGSVIPNYLIRQSTDSSSYCVSLNPLPVRLVYFKGFRDGSNIQLNWKIGMPGLANRFTIEKMANNFWYSLTEIKTDNIKETYQFIDAHANEGSNLYRLRLTEENGSYFYSAILKIITSQGKNQFDAYPNPASHQVVISGDFSPSVAIKIFDISGRLRFREQLTSPANSQTIDISSLQTGVYILQVGQEIKKMIINH